MFSTKTSKQSNALIPISNNPEFTFLNSRSSLSHKGSLWKSYLVLCDHKLIHDRFTFSKPRNVHVKNLSQALLVKYFDFFQKAFSSENSECGLSASAAYGNTSETYLY